MIDMLRMDHIVVSCEKLEAGVAYVEDVLGVAMSPGGQHPLMSTHNALLNLGNAYLEVIATDPDAPAPSRSRWFDLDHFSGQPRLTNWVAVASELSTLTTNAPLSLGQVTRLSRGDLEWDIVLSDDGCLPFDGAFPGLIDWGNAQHPTQRLADTGCQLARWTVCHPRADDIRKAMTAIGGEQLSSHIVPGKALSFEAVIVTPDGERILR